MRDRRMRLFSAFEEAKAAKARLEHDKAVDRYQHVLEMFEKRLKTVDTGLGLSKYSNELQGLRITVMVTEGWGGTTGQEIATHMDNQQSALNYRRYFRKNRLAEWLLCTEKT
jgi:hypothetical protein